MHGCVGEDDQVLDRRRDPSGTSMRQPSHPSPTTTRSKARGDSLCTFGDCSCDNSGMTALSVSDGHGSLARRPARARERCPFADCRQETRTY